MNETTCYYLGNISENPYTYLKEVSILIKNKKIHIKRIIMTSIHN